MSKRRTRKDKEKAIHTYVYRPIVNGQSVSGAESPTSKNISTENAINLAQDDSLASIKPNLMRSLITISFVLALELVIYFVFR
ncbi:MAG: hypothetical protein ABSA43_01990 [Candidatus Microgenomates bacterium]|jgi:hypothetical protein